MTVAFHEAAPTKFVLKSAVLLYQTEAVGHVAPRTTAFQHEVRQSADGALRFGEGEPVTASALNAMRDLLDDAPLTYVPPSIVAVGRSAVAWFEPAGIRPMFFNARSDAATQAFDKKPVPQPPLVFVARHHSLRVFALRDNVRPLLDTPLAAAPYWNVYEDGRVCLGTTAVPDEIDPSATAEWTRTFFASNFTHMNTGKRWAYGGTYAEMLHEAVAAGVFNPQWLAKPFTTIKDALCG